MTNRWQAPLQCRRDVGGICKNGIRTMQIAPQPDCLNSAGGSGGLLVLCLALWINMVLKQPAGRIKWSAGKLIVMLLLIAAVTISVALWLELHYITLDNSAQLQRLTDDTGYSIDR